MPYGTVVATHFEPYKRKKILGGDKVEEILFTAETQLEGLKASQFVALNQNGVITKNKVLVYDEGRDLVDEPHAADIVLEWALKQGVEPIVPNAGTVKPITSEQKKIEIMEGRISELEGQLKDNNSKLDKILNLISKEPANA